MELDPTLMVLDPEFTLAGLRTKAIMIVGSRLCLRQVLCTQAHYRMSSSWGQAESLKYKLLGGLAVRRACYGVLRFIMESGAKGAEVRN